MPTRLPRPLTVLRRPGGSVQVGLDVEGAFLVPGSVEDATGVLAALAAGAPDGVRAGASGPDPAWAAALASCLADRGLMLTRRAPRIEVWGAGVLADQVALLLDGRDGTLRRRPTPAHDDAGGRAASGRLVVLCSATAEPDRALTTALARARQSHLVVRLEAERAVVGPLVEPGLTCCVHCTDLVRRDVDADFTSLLVQLCRYDPPADPVLTAWAAATAAAQVRGWSHRAPGLIPGRTLELDAASGELLVRRWPVHPACGCGAPIGGQTR